MNTSQGPVKMIITGMILYDVNGLDDLKFVYTLHNRLDIDQDKLGQCENFRQWKAQIL